MSEVEGDSREGGSKKIKVKDEDKLREERVNPQIAPFTRSILHLPPPLLPARAWSEYFYSVSFLFQRLSFLFVLCTITKKYQRNVHARGINIFTSELFSTTGISTIGREKERGGEREQLRTIRTY